MTDLVLATNVSDEQRGYLQTARVSAESLLVILNDILDFFENRSGRLDLNPISILGAPDARRNRQAVYVPLAQKNLRLDTHVAPGVPELLVGDPDRLRQVLLNLIGNAVKFTASAASK